MVFLMIALQEVLNTMIPADIIKGLHKKKIAVMVMAEMPTDFSAAKVEIRPSLQVLHLDSGQDLKGADYFIGCDSGWTTYFVLVLDVPSVLVGSTHLLILRK